GAGEPSFWCRSPRSSETSSMGAGRGDRPLLWCRSPRSTETSSVGAGRGDRPLLVQKPSLHRDKLGGGGTPSGLVFHLDRGVGIGAGTEQLVAGARIEMLAVELVADVLDAAGQQHLVGDLPE